MKKLIGMTMALLVSMVSWAAVQTEEIVLFEGEEVCTNWDSYQVIAAASCKQIAEGDEIVVTVTAIGGTTADYPQAVLNDTKTWNPLVGTEPIQLGSIKDQLPYEAVWTVTEAMATEIKDNGFVVKGAYYTFTKVVLRHKTETGEEEGGEATIVPISLFEGEFVCADNWLTNLSFDESKFQLLAENDEIVVTISELSSGTQFPQLQLQDGSWQEFKGLQTIQLSGVSLPYEAKVTVTDTMATQIKENGLRVRGCGYTATKVVFNHKVYSTGVEKGDAATTVWTGNDVISWVTGNNHSVLVEATSLPAGLKAGDKVRVYITGLGVESATGRLLANWKTLDGFTNISPIKGNYYEYTLTETNVDSLKAYGLRISGNRYTATRVDIIDPDKEYLIVSQIEDADIKAWEKNETPNLTMTMTNVEAESVTVPYTITLYRDMVDDATGTHSVYQTYTTNVTIAAGATVTETIEMDDLTEPGFYQMIASVNGNDVCAYNIGYDPTGIVSESTAEGDFWDYWDKAKAELATIAMDTTLTEQADYSTDARKVYLVEMKSVADEEGGDPVTIMGYYAEPTAEGTYPVVIRYQGTDGGTSAVPAPMGGDDNPGWCEFVLSTRGQMLCRDPKYGYDFYSYGWGDYRKHYYRNAYLDCVRAVDFVKSREKVNDNAIFAAGGSQGGCFTYVAAGLTQAFRAIAPSITGHADFIDGMKIVNWPRQKFLDAQAGLSWTDAQRDKFNSYYDVMNFSSRVSCPVITSFSLQDATDPAHTNIAPYNLLQNKEKEDNQYIINPFLGHGTPGDWTQTYMKFFEGYLEDGSATLPPAVQTVTITTSKGLATYTSNVALDFSQATAIEAYTATVSGEVVTLTKATKVAAGEGVLLRSVSGGPATEAILMTSETVEPTAGNMLKGTLQEITELQSEESGYANYILNSNGPEGAGFYKANNRKVAAGKAYLRVPVAAAANMLFIRLDGGTTGIERVEAVETEADGVYYNLSGQRVSNPTRGIYILDGKKVIVK